ncbi:MAG: hypothetical protein KME19_21465 [Microcoleus vaginatus WJT46-NPBG5]|nr:hypothetical protein [Microcoleus vaginatus WJT46-NPBG5]
MSTNFPRRQMIDGLELAMMQLKAADSRTISKNRNFVADKRIETSISVGKAAIYLPAELEFLS